MRKVITSIAFLVSLTAIIWFVGIVGAYHFNDVSWVNGARALVAVPILILFNRRVFRFWGSEDIIPTYKLHEVGVHWRSGDDFDRATSKMRQFIQQLTDGRAKRIGIVLTVLGAFYYFLAPCVTK